jgi:two-component system, chemotaxis family, CheB/CheR fusion protein
MLMTSSEGEQKEQHAKSERKEQERNKELATNDTQLEVKLAELETTSNDLHNLLASSNIATVFLDQNFRIKRYTPSTARLLRLIPGDLGRSIADIAGCCRDPGLLADAQKVLDTRVPVETEVPTETHEWYIRRVQPYRTQDHRIDGIVITYFDITERRRREEEQARLAAIIESSSDAIISKSLDGIVTSWNAAAERVFGYSAAEAVGRPMSFLLPPGVPNEFPSVVERLGRGERIETFETVRRRKDGYLIYVAVTASAIRDASEALIGFSDIERDISERRLTEQVLREQKQRLAEADRRKDEFLAMLGHELRNPLATISNTINTLKNKDMAADPQRVQWGIGMVERQTRRLMHLVDDLLDVVRITRGKVDLRPARINLNAAIEDAIQGTRTLIEERKLEVNVNLPTAPVWLNADPTRLAQVFSNLLANAVWYTEHPGQIDVTVTQADNHATVRIHDTGIGIPQELLPHIFNLFTQGPEARHKREKGLGIGLTLVRQLVELHGGCVTAVSQGPGKGSDFTVKLPLDRQEVDNPV